MGYLLPPSLTSHDTPQGTGSLFHPARALRAFLFLEFAMNQAVRITGKKAVYIDRRSSFDPSKPEKTRFEGFSLFAPTEDGSPDSYWTREGYILVGMANVEIELMPAKEVTTNAVAALRKQKEAVIAAAQYEATQIEQRIQSLLAITNEA